ncbi:MAG: hypothetical protein WA996_11660 [Candidatus Promineifilaceae bacterium]
MDVILELDPRLVISMIVQRKPPEACGKVFSLVEPRHASAYH